jgi:outer membrane protein assembly factor BamB
MKNSVTARVLLAALAMTLLLGADWPQWRGPARDGKLAGFTPPADWKLTVNQKWKVQVGIGDSTPALVGDKIYVLSRLGADESLVCLDAASGTEVWKKTYTTPAVSGPSASQHAGPRSSPAVADGKIVTLSASGILSCWDAAKGDLLWRNEEYKTVPQFYTATSPLLLDGVCYVHLGGRGKGTFLALELATGKEKWKWDGDGPSYSSPELLVVDGTKQIVQMTETNIVGLNLADGKGPLWSIPFVTSGMGYNAASPIIVGPLVYITGQSRGTKCIKIDKQGDGFAPTDVWSNPKIGTQFNTPILKDGFLYGLSDAGAFFCLDAKNGDTKWTWSGQTRMGNYSGMVDAGTAIIALPTTDLIAFKPSSEKYEELARVKVCDSPTFAFPVISGKSIYVRDRDALVLWSID